jgi:hypothetical protein
LFPKQSQGENQLVAFCFNTWREPGQQFPYSLPLFWQAKRNCGNRHVFRFGRGLWLLLAPSALASLAWAIGNPKAATDTLT